jgi:hypothetical protein
MLSKLWLLIIFTLLPILIHFSDLISSLTQCTGPDATTCTDVYTADQCKQVFFDLTTSPAATVASKAICENPRQLGIFEIKDFETVFTYNQFNEFNKLNIH